MLWALSVAGDDARFLDEIGRMRSTIREARAAPDGFDALGVLWSCISITHERLGAQRLKETLTAAVGRDDAEVIVTTWEEIQEEGRKKGCARTLLELLAAKFGPVPDAAKERVAAADEATLRRWSLRVLTETTLAGVLRNPKPKLPKKAAHRGRLARV